MPTSRTKQIAAAALAWLTPVATSAQALPPPRPMVIGMNAPGVVWWASTFPFANLVIGSEWQNTHWAPLGTQYQDGDGNLLSLPVEGALRHLGIPPTGPEGTDIRCTWTGSGRVNVEGGGHVLSTSRNSIRFHVVSHHNQPGPPWLTVLDVDPRQGLHDLDCRDVRLAPDLRFRPAFVDTLRGYGVIRFMDWQNANTNAPLTWAARHKPTGSRTLDEGGVSIEDMMALVGQLGADPWFVMPWNADDAYIRGFAQLVAQALPANRHVYVEVGNEVWNGQFDVARQAVREGHERGLGADDLTAGMHRYAERTGEVMRVWEAAFARRKGLVRVLSAQHVRPDTARIALSWKDTASHVDALATAPYFGDFYGGTDNTRETVIAKLTAAIDTTLREAVVNRQVAASFGKRYIAYEGGEGLALPAQAQLLDQMQHDPAQVDLYRRYLTGWRRDVGDVLCLLTSVAQPVPTGSWGLAAWEDETPAQAPKLRAVREFAPAR